jgi:mono/diheme cytochrome c family protein
MKSRPVFLVWIVLAFQACNDSPYQQGEILYKNYCANCHIEDGAGLKGIIPPLAGSDYLAANQRLLPCLIRNGYKGDMVVNGHTYQTEMQGIKDLSEFEITNIINYINTAWGNDIEPVKHLDVRAALQTCD